MTLVAHKPSNISHEIAISNPGQTLLEWEVSTTGFADLSVSPASGTLEAQELTILTADFASAQTQARADPCEILFAVGRGRTRH